MEFHDVNTNSKTGEVTYIPWSQDRIDEWNAQEAIDVWVRLRNERNKRLSSCDWTQSLDAPVDQAAWAAYRQELRDLPANTTDPYNPVWPTPPA